MRRLRYGLVGCGMMGREHIRNLALLPGTEVTAIADPDAEQRKLNRVLLPKAFVTADHEALLARDDVDVLVVASPNHTHRPVLEGVFRSRPRPVLVEKPLAAGVLDARWIAERAQSWPCPVWTAMEYRYMPPVAALLDEVRQGTAGKLRMLTIREHRFAFLDKVGHWNRFNHNTGGTLVEKCCHFFDLMRLILQDEPVRVFASGGSNVNHTAERYDEGVPDVLDNAYVIVDFAGGARAMLELCMFAEGAWWQEEITAVGERARLTARVPGPARFWPGGDERASELEIAPREPKGPILRRIEVDHAILGAGDHHGSTFYQHQRFQSAIRDGGPVEVTAGDGLEAVRIGEAAERSARDGTPVSLRPAEGRAGIVAA